MKYYFCQPLDMPFERAVERTVEELRGEGFEIIAESDIQTILREKSGLDFPRYTVILACSPELLRRAILAEEHIGLMLPCGILVREMPDGGVEVSALDPIASMMAVESGELRMISFEIQKRLRKVVERVSGRVSEEGPHSSGIFSGP